jgi:hypothetical protein
MNEPISRTLICHPETPDPWVQRLDVRIGRSPAGAFHFTYVLTGALDHLRIPRPGVPGRRDRLWEHTCFEAFLAIRGEAAYHEFNFSPSLEWAAYAFRSYRERKGSDPELDPLIQVETRKERLILEATVPLDSHHETSLRLALSAVIEDESGNLSYWALRHSPGKPDFHHADAFALDLDAP